MLTKIAFYAIIRNIWQDYRKSPKLRNFMAIKYIKNFITFLGLTGAFLISNFLLVGIVSAADPWTTPPTVTTHAASSIGETFVLLNGEANPNGNKTGGWFEWGTNTALGGSTLGAFTLLGEGSSTIPFSYRLTGLLPGKIYYFRAVAESIYDVKARGAILSFSTKPEEVLQDTSSGGTSNPPSSPPASPPSPPQSVQNAPSITTRPATFVGRASALINGAANPNGLFTSSRFEWGKTTVLGASTAFHPMGNGINSIDYNFLLTNLEPNTIYYYRAVAQNNLGISRGAILSFTTQSITNIPVSPPSPAASLPSFSPPASPSSSKPPAPALEKNLAVITLSPSVDQNEPAVGEEFKFDVVYKNESKISVRDAVLKIELPDGIEYISSNLKPHTQNEDKLEFRLGTFGAESQGAISTLVKVKNGTEKGKILVFRAVLDYKDGDDTSKSASVFIAVTVKNGNAFFAAIFGAFGNFWGLLLGILLFLLLFMFFILFWRKRKEKEKKENAKDEFAVMPGRL